MTERDSRMIELVGLMFQAHPWHGVSAGSKAPDKVMAYVEIVPSDQVKYELNKPSGHLMIDRPQRYSSLVPSLYGFVPQTYCAEAVAELCMQRTGRTGIQGDGDPLDICILAEPPFRHGNFLARSVPIGGFRMIDGDEADDKIVAVLVDDNAYGNIQDISEAPSGIVDRLKHYFLTYKEMPSAEKRKVEITEVYGREEALEVIRRSQKDYRAHYGNPETRLKELKNLLLGD
ncbi:MAG: inorganic pyrophosphatase [Myxococcaceae bacterium]